jgi:hypothetical protein
MSTATVSAPIDDKNAKKDNTPKQFMEFFSSPANCGVTIECKPAEFRSFWAACSEEEKALFRAASLS